MSGKRAKAIRKIALESGIKDWRWKYRLLKKQWTRGKGYYGLLQQLFTQAARSKGRVALNH